MRHLYPASLLALLLLTVGCDKPADDSSESTQTESSNAESEQVEEHFALSSEASATDISVEVTPRNGFKINVEYPWQLSFVDAPEGAPATLASSDAATFDENAARFNVERGLFGDREDLQAELRFSVCSDETCLLKTKQINWELP